MGRTQRIRNLRKRLNGDLSDQKCYFQLLKWMKDKTNGWQPTDLELQLFDVGLRGLKTTRIIAPLQNLIQVPHQLLVTRNVALGHLQFGHKLSTHQLLALFLISSPSEWTEYLESLPTTYDVPFFSSELEIQALPNYLKEKVKDQRNQVKAQFLECLQFLPDLKFSQFAWAFFTVNTRAVFHKDGWDNLALVPFLDMFNHSPDVEVEANCNGQHYSLKNINQSYGVGEQVYINYGPHSNVKLFLEYGFILPHNPHDFVPIDVPELMEVCGSSPGRLEVIRELDLTLNLGIDRNGEPSWNVGACLYILSSDASDSRETVFEQGDFLELKLIKSMCLLLIDKKLARVRKSVENLRRIRVRRNEVALALLNVHLDILMRAWTVLV